MSDLVKRLRDALTHWRSHTEDTGIIREAAAAIERKDAALRKAQTTIMNLVSSNNNPVGGTAEEALDAIDTALKE